MKKFAILVAAASMVAAASAYAEGPTKAEVGAAVQAAVKSIEAAKKERGEWRDSYKILGKAKKAYKAGDYAEAMKLAKKAENQGHLGKAQAMAEANAGPDRFFK